MSATEARITSGWGPAACRPGCWRARPHRLPGGAHVWVFPTAAHRFALAALGVRGRRSGR